MSQLEFGPEIVEQLERVYRSRDVLRRRALVHAALGAQRGDRVLDVGCGSGFFVTEILDTVGPEGSVVGIDLSPDMLAVAAKRAEGYPNVEFAESPAVPLPVADAAFDRALSVQVLEYVDDVPGALRELHRALKPGGRVVVWDVDWSTVSLQSADTARMRRVLDAWDQHLTDPFLPRTLSGHLRDAGFDDVEMQGHVFATSELDPETYGGYLVPLIRNYVVEHGLVAAELADAWQAEQRQLAGDGRFYFTVTQFCFTATRP
jgi:ubiquinone/menaquinone biosynthesis C-methylase UbiE